jgi:pyridoxamine 5'-phosphate oxidase
VGLSDRRREYDTTGLERADLAEDPITQFTRWFADASNAGLEEPHAMMLATTAPDRRPNARLVLLRGVDERGFVWFTNRHSQKGRELEVTPFATLVFAWIPLHRQIRVDGEVSIIDDAESDEYFASRPRAAQVGAWASQQSEVLEDRATLEAAVRAIEQRFGEGEITRPPHWGGYRLAHETLEVWQGRANRLHDRFRYRPEAGGWLIERLWP